MSSTEKYFKFFKNFIRDYSKLVLSSFYKSSLIKDLVAEYINIRYYNLYEQKHKSNSKNLQYYLELKCKELINVYDKDLVSKSLYFIWYITYLDNINKCDNINDLIENIITSREKILSLNDDIKRELSDLIKTFVKQKEEFFMTFESKEFILNDEKTSNRKVFIENINYNIKFPKIYSSYSINKVFKSDIINENINFILYNMVANKILENVICSIYDIYFIVPFPISIIEKKDKLNRLFEIIDNDVIKNNIVINIKYADYIKNKELFNEYISLGYNLSLELDEVFEYTEKNLIWLSAFKYVLGNSELIPHDKLIER